MVHVEWAACPRYPAHELLYWDRRTGQVANATGGECQALQYEGDGRFVQLAADGPLGYATPLTWDSGRLAAGPTAVTLNGPVGLDSLPRTLAAIASQPVMGAERLFLFPEVLAEFRALTGPGRWSFTPVDSPQPGPPAKTGGYWELRLEARRDGLPRGTLVVEVLRPFQENETGVRVSRVRWSR